ncbi:hypothetical protein TNCV_2510231 [Trichonephila clavipes]|nr:hypothetical protein TNCV_2510231 [Trichonephila clavipes]
MPMLFLPKKELFRKLKAPDVENDLLQDGGVVVFFSLPSVVEVMSDETIPQCFWGARVDMNGSNGAFIVIYINVLLGFLWGRNGSSFQPTQEEERGYVN